MQNRFRVKIPPNAILGAFFALVGIALAAAAVWYAVSGLIQDGLKGLLLSSEGCILMLAFAALFLWAGGSQVIPAIRQIAGQKQASESGRLIYATFDRVDDVPFKINGKYLQKAVLTWVDENGWQRECHSRAMRRVPVERLRGAQIPVYIDNDDPDNYYFDLDSFLKQQR